MSGQKCGKHSFKLSNPPVVTTWASVAGKREAEGPLGSYFDKILKDTYVGKNSWEQAEGTFQLMALDTLLKKANMTYQDIDVVLSGDLLNQCIGSSFTLNKLNTPHLGLYGACSTMAESLLIASMVVSGGYMTNAVAMTSSHFASSERQYRFPLNYGGQRTPTAQWTVTGAGAALVCQNGKGPKITGCTIGTVTELGVKDANNMGAAMAPAALATIQQHFQDFQISANAYDLIVTGDLGQVGKELLLSLAGREGLNIAGKLEDCGTIVFDLDHQDVHSGGSGCGCSAITLCSKLLNQLQTGKYKKILFCGTGALLSPASVQQGLTIPAVCHAVILEANK